MNKTLIVLAVAALVGSAFSQKPLPTEVKCPVMNSNTVKVANAEKSKMYTDWKGKRYYVCCAGCIPEFKKNPQKYSKKTTGMPIPKPH